MKRWNFHVSLLVTIFCKIIAFYYSSEKCPQIDHVYIKPQNFPEVSLWKEQLRYPDQNLETIGFYKEICTIVRIGKSGKFMRFIRERIFDGIYTTQLNVNYCIEYYNQSDYGVFRLAPAVVTKNVFYPDKIKSTIPYVIHSEITDGCREHFEIKVIHYERTKIMILWGCEQINRETSRRTLKLLCESNYYCGEKLIDLRALIISKIGNATEIETVHHGNLCKLIKKPKPMPFRLQDENGSRCKKCRFDFICFTIVTSFLLSLFF